MSGGIVYERLAREAEVANAWWRLPTRALLPLSDGRHCLLIYAGQPGGSAGPDVRDAVLQFLAQSPVLVEEDEVACDVEFHIPTEQVEVVGDVEFHIRASDWFAHGHHLDPRYNQVLLHVVLYLDGETPTRRQDGSEIPTCSLLDIPQIFMPTQPWPCEQNPLGAIASTTTLLYAGLLRLEAKSETLSQELARSSPPPGSAFDARDTCLIPALAEALGYGRDRAFFRAAGTRLVGISTRLPEPLGRARYPAPLDARRLRALYILAARWRKGGAWDSFQPAFQPDLDSQRARTTLRAALHPLGTTRADILICNVILPFATTIAELEHNSSLAVRAQQLYLSYPGLTSNRITRMISAQLQLTNEPGQACLQQGLHHIYMQTCREKQCANCLCGGKRL